MQIVIPGPSAFFVRWTCRRCGTTGHARTTIPVTPDWSEGMMRRLFEALKTKLVVIHLRRQSACVPSYEDFDITRGVPEDKEIVGLI